MRRRLYQLVVILVCLFIIQGLSRGLIELSAQERRLGRARAELEKLQQKQVELKRQLEYFRSDEYVEKIARDKLLLAKPGETVLILPKENNADLLPSSFFPLPSEAEPQLPNWQKWLKLFGW
jgi:cell division protein FtsB